jgi:hypothetical protein
VVSKSLSYRRAIYPPSLQNLKQVVPVHSAYFAAFGRFYDADPMSFAEFRAFDVNTLPAPK